MHIKTVLCLYRCFNIFTFLVHIYSFSSVEQDGDTERAFRNVALREPLQTCLHICNMHMLLVKRHFESSVADWGFVDI